MLQRLLGGRVWDKEGNLLAYVQQEKKALCKAED
jgi:acyl-CoA thioesterase